MQISQYFGDDIQLAPNGDILQSDGDELTEQSIIRRLFTNPGSYIWHPEYGAGIGRFVGQNLSTDNYDEIRNLITSQILLEDTVAKSPRPEITFSIINRTILQCSIIYYDAVLKIPKGITFPVS